MDIREIERLISPVFEQESVELVDLQFASEGSKKVLRFFVDKSGGITLDDCAYLSERVGAFLDESDAIPQNYVLEISSPGVDRIIKKENDFKRFAGSQVKVRLKVPEGGRRNFKGVLRGYEDRCVLLEAEGRVWKFDHEGIEEARLDVSVDI